MAKFEVVKRFADSDVKINLPVRATKCAAGYDFEAAEDIDLIPYSNLMEQLVYTLITNERDQHPLYTTQQIIDNIHALTLDEMNSLTKQSQCKPTLIPTGVKCKLDPDEYLELAVRSSCPLKYWIEMANGVGVIDADYYGNPDNDGEIFFQVINMSPIAIHIKKGEKIGQGIIQKYIKTEDDCSETERVGGFGSTDETTGA